MANPVYANPLAVIFSGGLMLGAIFMATDYVTSPMHIGEYSDKEKILLHLAAHAEHFTTHPIGAALRTAFPQEATDGCEVTDVEEIAGQGIRAKVNGKVVCVGNKKMMESIGAQWHDCNQVGTIIHVAIDGKYAGPEQNLPSI